MRDMIALIVLACLCAAIGMATLSQATAGVGLLAFACLFAIFARMAQSERQHQAALRQIRDQQPNGPTPIDTSAVWFCQRCGHQCSPHTVDCQRCGATRTA